MRLTFESCVLDLDTREVTRAGQTMSLSPKAFALLEILALQRPKALSKAEIHAALWPDTFVSETNLANLVVELRAALGDSAQKPHIIRTIPRFGYAFCADARVDEAKTAAAQDAGPAYRLIWGRREIALDPGENLIGRDRDAVVWIDHEAVSRRHARVVIDPEAATLEDLGSKNGTICRGQKIEAVVRLDDRDTIKIGPASMVFRVLRRTGSTLSGIQDRAR